MEYSLLGCQSSYKRWVLGTLVLRFEGLLTSHTKTQEANFFMCRNYAPHSWQAAEKKIPHLETVLVSGISA